MIRPKVLFLFTANRCRTQMAEAFLHDLAGDRFDISSAGYEEATDIWPDAIAVMRELGLDISEQHPKKASRGRQRPGTPAMTRDEIQRYVTELVQKQA
jgi:protein-tyrosine-phosphatase